MSSRCSSLCSHFVRTLCATCVRLVRKNAVRYTSPMAHSEKNTLQKIHAVATEEFLEKGFRGASLREIVRKAGVTTGAFYGYYRSKEDLFDALVAPHADYVRGIFDRTMDDFRSLPPSEWAAHMGEYSRKGMREMYEYAYDHADAFRLILNASEGTRYEQYVHSIVEEEVDMTHRFYEVITAQGYEPKTLNPTLEHIIVSGQFSALFELIVHDIPKEEGLRCVRELHDFFQAGWAGILGYR